ncbi:hypothetical protein AB0469_18000 [Streptomyces sp. NPDC093801]|uniref:hypothetical protein n=1 Tax=Streptomyces sp. NPDC093801 TaxID=3155203 RepID=UPI00344F61EC
MNTFDETRRSGWGGAGRAGPAPVADVPRWARVVAHGIPLIVLPSGVWRIAAVVSGAGSGSGRHGTAGAPADLPGLVYVTFLSVLSELLAFAAVGLVAAWGEVFPRWVPVLRGRRVPARAVVTAALLGAAVLTVLWTALAVRIGSGTTLQGDPLPDDFPTVALHGRHLAFFVASYAPLLLWGPLLALLAIAYRRRRRAEVPCAPAPEAEA